MANEHDFLMHYGIRGQRWGIRRYQNEDGTLTAEGLERYGSKGNKKDLAKKIDSAIKSGKDPVKYLRDTPQFKDALGQFKKDNEDSIKKYKEANEEYYKIMESWYDEKNPDYKKYAEKFAKELASTYGSESADPEEEYKQWLDLVLYDDLDQGETQTRYFNDHPKEKDHYNKIMEQMQTEYSNLVKSSNNISSGFLGEYGDKRLYPKGSSWSVQNEMAKALRKEIGVD